MGKDDAPILAVLPPLRMFCEVCGRRERFEVVRADDLAFDLHAVHQNWEFHVTQWALNDQVFGISSLCQGCKRFPEALLVRRVAGKNRLVLSGRTPMESPEVPGNLPEPEVTYFRDAVIAHESGKTLAGLFYLRTFVEQFARRTTGESGRRPGQEIMAAYSKTLAAPLRDMMPSLGECYDRLSEAIHAARADAALFDEVRGKIEQHFAFLSAAQLRT